MMSQLSTIGSFAAILFLSVLSPVLGNTGGATGDPIGFALTAGTTGGGSATAATPSDAAELKSWLEDDVARVIVSIGVEIFTVKSLLTFSDRLSAASTASLVPKVPAQTVLDAFPRPTLAQLEVNLQLTIAAGAMTWKAPQ